MTASDPSALAIVIDEYMGGEHLDLAAAVSAAGPFKAQEFLDGLERGLDASKLLDLCIRQGALTEPAWAVMTTWSYLNSPERELGAARWVELFREVGYTVDGRAAARRQSQVRLYRRAPHGWERGMSWTSCADLIGPGKTWTARVRPSQILARCSWRGEREYVLDPAGLNVTLVHSN